MATSQEAQQPLKQPAFATCQEPIGPKYQHPFAASANPAVCPQQNTFCISWSKNPSAGKITTLTNYVSRYPAAAY